MQTGIGEMVEISEITRMNLFISKFGEEAFNSAVFNGAFSEVAYAYIHPFDKLRSTDRFQIIQKAFINAYI